MIFKNLLFTKWIYREGNSDPVEKLVDFEKET